MNSRKRKQCDIVCNRVTAKLNTECNNLRNRLYRLFGNTIHLKNGTLPSEKQNLTDLLLRTCSKLKHGVDADLSSRSRVVTIGLATVLHDTNMAVTADDIQKTILEASDHVSKVRVMASQLTNFICIRNYSQGLPFPERNEQFYTACLACCRSSRTSYQAVKDSFAEFTAATGITPISALKGTSQIFTYQAGSMQTASDNFMEYAAPERQITLLKWKLKRVFHPTSTTSAAIFDKKIGQLCNFVVNNEFEDGPETSIKLKLASLGLPDLYFEIDQVCSMVVDQNSGSGDLLYHIIEMQVRN